MKRFTGSLFALSLLAAVACSDDDDVSERKGQVDEEALADDGVVATLNGNTASVVVPFAVSVPNADDEDLEVALADSAAVSLRSDVTGTTASLTDGELVDDSPSAAGEFSWELNEARDELTFTFYNETPAGTTLKSDRTYTASISISTNDYVATLPATMVAVDVN